MAWLPGWPYRKLVTLSRADGLVTNYQVRVSVGENSGDGDVDFNGHGLATFNDLRFTNSDGVTLQHYWIEQITGAASHKVAAVWLECDSIGTGATTFYMYYGKKDAVAYTNGADTFIVFDDFERGVNGDSVGGSWVETPHVHISTERTTRSGYTGSRSAKFVGAVSPPDVYIPVENTGSGLQNYSIRLQFYKEIAAYASILKHGNGTRRTAIVIDQSENILYYDGSWKDTTTNITADQWQHLEIQSLNFTAYTYRLFLEGVVVGVDPLPMAVASTFDEQVSFQGDSVVGQDYWIDDFFVRQRLAVEPAWGSWGDEEVILPRHGVTNFQNPGIA